jgi:hypothetical protein
LRIKELISSPLLIIVALHEGMIMKTMLGIASMLFGIAGAAGAFFTNAGVGIAGCAFMAGVFGFFASMEKVHKNEQ